MIRIDGYPIDVAPSEEHSLRSEVTKHPMEEGLDVASGIRNDPEVIKLEGVVSDTPIGAVAKDETRTTPLGAQLPSRDAYQRLLDIRKNKRRVTLELDLGKFESMALTELTIPRRVQNVKGLQFTVVFEHVRVVSNKRVTVSIPIGAKKTKLGARDSKPQFITSTRWAYSIRREKESLTTNPSLGGLGLQMVPHQPVVDPVYGRPIISTRTKDRINVNGYDRDDWLGYWVDHYDLGFVKPGRNDYKIWHKADGLINTVSFLGTRAGYSFFFGEFPAGTSTVDPDGTVRSYSPLGPSAPQTAAGVLPGPDGQPVNQHPPSHTIWGQVLDNNQ